jgi:uncharacterized membrane protein
MNKKTKICLVAAIGAVIAQSASAHLEPKKNENKEKCYGVVKAGANDCASKANNHSCATFAKKDNDPNEWIKLPKGLCERLSGGDLKPQKES